MHHVYARAYLKLLYDFKWLSFCRLSRTTRRPDYKTGYKIWKYENNTCTTVNKGD